MRENLVGGLDRQGLEGGIILPIKGCDKPLRDLELYWVLENAQKGEEALLINDIRYPMN